MKDGHSPRAFRLGGIFLAWVLLLPMALAQPTPISDAQAAAHVGERMTVQGTVANVHTSRKGHTFINFGAPYPNQDFTAVVFVSNAAAFKDLPGLSGKHVQVTGVVRLYGGKPEIILQTRSQLTILER